VLRMPMFYVLWIAYALGDDQIRLLDAETHIDRPFVIANFTYGASFAWSPDSQWILFSVSVAGIPQSVVEVRVVDAEGRDAPVGDSGEIVVRGDTVMRGYWNNADATAATLRDGWLWTGDVGALDAHGFLTLKDRSKDLIISGGSNVYPREVEEALMAHPGVEEACVVGRPHPEWGEEVVAFIVRRAGAAVDEATLDQLCLERIARFKRPRAYRFVDALPKSNYGKVLKREVRQWLDDDA